jgi:hypothetical protein
VEQLVGSITAAINRNGARKKVERSRVLGVMVLEHKRKVGFTVTNEAGFSILSYPPRAFGIETPME